MPLVFLNPWAGLLALLFVVPLVAFARLRERDRHVRSALGLPAASRRTLVAPVAAATAAVLLLVLAATQPAVVRSTPRAERTDVEALFVLDISRSMLAAATPASLTRFDRARAVTARIRSALPAVPAGLASLTDRVLPHVLPTGDAAVFRATLRTALAVDSPPPTNIYYERATALGALADVPSKRFFSPAAKKRLLVVVTDGESRSVGARQSAALRAARVRTVFVHVWRPGEQVFATGRPERTYRPNPESGLFLENLARQTGGIAVAETDVSRAVAAARAAVGAGAVRRVDDRRYVPLMRPVALAALVPLALVLWIRNAWVVARARRFVAERRNTWLASRQQSQRSSAPPPQPLRP